MVCYLDKQRTYRSQGLGFRVEGLGFLGFLTKVQDSGSTGLGLAVEDLGFRVKGSGFGV